MSLTIKSNKQLNSVSGNIINEFEVFNILREMEDISKGKSSYCMFEDKKNKLVLQTTNPQSIVFSDDDLYIFTVGSFFDDIYNIYSEAIKIAEDELGEYESHEVVKKFYIALRDAYKDGVSKNVDFGLEPINELWMSNTKELSKLTIEYYDIYCLATEG